MKTNAIGILSVVLCFARTVAQGQLVHDVSRDYLSETNPGPVWSYGWKSSLAGEFTPLKYHLVEPATKNSAWELWQIEPGRYTAVYRNTGTDTLYSDEGAGVYPPGSVWFAPGPEPTEDQFAVIRFTTPVGLGGRYRIAAEVRTRLDVGGSDADFHVLHNTKELFGQDVFPVSTAAYTNDLTLKEGDTIDFICGRGPDGMEYGGGLKIAASIFATSILRKGAVTIRVSEVEVCWETEANQWYQVQYQSALTTNQWAPLFPGFLLGTGSMQCTNDPVPVGALRRFYRTVSFTNEPPKL